MICAWEAFSLPETATGAPGQHVQQLFWWLLSGFPSQSSVCVPAGATWLRRALCPSLHPSGGKYSPPLPCRQPGTPVRVSHRDSGGEKKIPPSHRNHQLFQQRVSTMSGPRLCQPGGSQPLLPPACSTPRAEGWPEGWPEAVPKLAATWGHQPCSHLLWDTLVSCGTAHSTTAAGQGAVAWDPGGSGEMALKEDTGNVAHLAGNISRALRERH